MTQLPVFQPERCIVESVWPVSRQSWLRYTEVPQAPGDTVDCGGNNQLLEPSLPCPGIAATADQVQLISSMVPVGYEQTGFNVTTKPCCEFDYDLLVQFPCANLLPQRYADMSVDIPEEGSPSVSFRFVKTATCDWTLEADLVIPCSSVSPDTPELATPNEYDYWPLRFLKYYFIPSTACDWDFTQEIKFPCMWIEGYVQYNKGGCAPATITAPLVQMIQTPGFSSTVQNDCAWQLYWTVIYPDMSVCIPELGSPGLPGLPGPQGPGGDPGPQGPYGVAGAQGPLGSDGATGEPGPSGAQGVDGLDNTVKGSQGPGGSAGNKGPTGPAGASGRLGPPGYTGPKGLQGYSGVPVTGSPGPQGLPGSCFVYGSTPGEPKSAIVAYHDDFVGVFCTEMPEVMFADILTVTLGPDCCRSESQIDLRFLDVCVPGSLRVIGVVPNLPIDCGAEIDHDRVVIRRPVEQSEEPLLVTIKIMGVRRDRENVRFPVCTYEQMVKNNRFWSRSLGQ